MSAAGWRRAGVGVLAAVVVLAGLGALLLRDRPAEPAYGERVVIRGPAGELAYHRAGAGEAVVLLPSFARSASDFNALARALQAAGYRSLALQPRGVEGSVLGGWRVGLRDYAADVAAMLDAEGVARAQAIVGHAYGNRVARVFATAYPARVEALVLLAAGGGSPPPPEVSAAIRKAVFGIGEAGRAAAIAFAFFAPGNAVPAAWQRGWYPLAALQQTRATTAQDYAGWRDGGSAPMLLLQPADDLPAPPEQSRALAARHPERVRRELIAGAGHALLPERPDEVAGRFLAYLRENGGRAR